MKTETIYFAAGCFWHVQYIFDIQKGVVETQVGYMGGDEKTYPNPTYKQVCSEKTNYAETVKVVYDSDKASFDELMSTFWNEHDPTSVNEQGGDVGTQYRSIVFYTNEEQHQKAINSKNGKQQMLGKPIVTSFFPADQFKFFPAEEYHQKYFERN